MDSHALASSRVAQRQMIMALIVLAFVGSIFAIWAAPNASARCATASDDRTLSYVVSGSTYSSERSYYGDSDCNANADYDASLKDGPTQDGSCAKSFYYDEGVLHTTLTACDSDWQTKNHTADDAFGTMRLFRNGPHYTSYWNNYYF